MIDDKPRSYAINKSNGVLISRFRSVNPRCLSFVALCQMHNEGPLSTPCSSAFCLSHRRDDPGASKDQELLLLAAYLLHVTSSLSSDLDFSQLPKDQWKKYLPE